MKPLRARSRRTTRSRRAPRCIAISTASAANSSEASKMLRGMARMAKPYRVAEQDVCASLLRRMSSRSRRRIARGNSPSWVAHAKPVTDNGDGANSSSTKEDRMTKNTRHFAARHLYGFLGVLACAATLLAAVLPASAQVPALPKSPVTLNIVDVAGNLALTQDAIEQFRSKHPQLLSKISFTKAPAPELPGKLKAMQDAGRSDIDMVLTGTDFLAAGIEQGVLMKILPTYASKFPSLMANYQPAAAKMQELAGDYGITVVFMPAGPLLEYNPDKV